MGYFESLYASELPHRAVAVYMYLRDREDKDGKMLSGARYHRRRTETVTEYRKKSHCRPRKEWLSSQGESVA